MTTVKAFPKIMPKPLIGIAKPPIRDMRRLNSTLLCRIVKAKVYPKIMPKPLIGIAKPPIRDMRRLNSTLLCRIVKAKVYSGPQDYAQAAYWFRKAADQGDADAQFNLGAMYDNGQGVPQDYAQAAYWYRKAADQGNAKAQVNLALAYGNGEGVLKDDVTALMWLYISYVRSEGTPVQKTVSELLDKITLPKQQIEEAQQRAKAWLAAHPKNN